MTGYLKRLVASGAAYQASSLLSAAFGVLTLPLYTRHLTSADYGYAETLLTFIIFTSILLRLGLGEAFVRFWFDDEDEERRARLLRTVFTTTLVATTVAALIGLALAGPLSQALLQHRDVPLMAYGLLGLWAFSNLEIGYALLRVEDRRVEYVLFTAGNVLLTVASTIVLVVVLDEGARGYVLGNYGASAVVLLAVWLRNARRLKPLLPDRALEPLVRFGGPTVPADATVFALNVVDRAYLLRTESPAAAGRYAVAVKLATAVIVVTRGFQAAWPPLAYSITDDVEAGRLYARVTRLYVLATGLVVVALTLLGRWLVRLLADGDFYEAHEALPWVALGWALYGLNLVLITIAGRAKVTTRNFPAAAAGVVVNVVALVILVPLFGIAGAGIALCAAYLVMVLVLHLLTRRLFTVPFEWRRMAVGVAVLTAAAVLGEVLLPDHGAAGLLLRVTLLTLTPVALVLGGGIAPSERAWLAAKLRSSTSHHP